jgi:hypothetical protein
MAEMIMVSRRVFRSSPHLAEMKARDRCRNVRWQKEQLGESSCLKIYGWFVIVYWRCQRFWNAIRVACQGGPLHFRVRKWHAAPPEFSPQDL